jgi:hypothetical protein
MKMGGRLIAMSALSVRGRTGPPQDGGVLTETLAPAQRSPQTELTFLGRVSSCPLDPVSVLAAHMKRESHYQISGKALAAKLFSADRTAGVRLPRQIDLQHRLVFRHDT